MDEWRFIIKVWPSQRIGYRWYVLAVLNGRPDPSAPEGYRWAPTLASAHRQAAKESASHRRPRPAGELNGIRDGSTFTRW